MSSLPQDLNSISRRDFLKLKSLLIVWFYFLQSFGINVLAKETKKIDYSLLDKLKELNFSKEVKKELDFRVYLQKKYCTDVNGKLNSLDRFIKEMTNFIVSQKDFNDFKLLNSVKDEQIDLGYMINSTAKHNELRSLKYLQNKILSNKDDKMLEQALLYSINSQSIDTTIHLIKQKLNIDKNTQKTILLKLQQKEYDKFYEKLTNRNLLPQLAAKNYDKHIRKLPKRIGYSDYRRYATYKNFEESLFDIVYNSVAHLYMNYVIDDFDVKLNNKKVQVSIWNHNSIYPYNFIQQLDKSLILYGYDDLIDEFKKYSITDIEEIMRYKKFLKDAIVCDLRDINRYSFIEIDVL